MEKKGKVGTGRANNKKSGSTAGTKRTGIAIPLGAIRTGSNSVIGDYLSLEKLIPFCKKTGLSIIQLLPVNDTGTNSSPYSGLSAFALHPIYISLEATEGFASLYETDSEFRSQYDKFVKKHTHAISKTKNRFNYIEILNDKTALLKKLFVYNFQLGFDEENDTDNTADKEFSKWIEKNPWIKGYTVFKTLKEKYMQASWKTWSKEDQKIDADAIDRFWKTEDAAIREKLVFFAWCQYVCHIQFKKACDAVKKEGIILKGDMPILMDEDSCDAWQHKEIFNHTLRAGSPPDMYNSNGQNWGFPIYNWKYLKKNDYSWWKDRLISASQYYSAYRLDHILGFFRIWAVPENDNSAILGHTEPYKGITAEQLSALGFDAGRIHWLSAPHIPTSAIKTENPYAVLEKYCDRIGNEELWNFKKEIKGDKFIDNDELRPFWFDRCLIEIKDGVFVPAWSYRDSTSWKSLFPEEQRKLSELFAQKNEEESKLWTKLSSDILSELTTCTKMIPCGEDLGVGLECVPAVMKKFNILSLKVLRWCRLWEKEGQPFIDVKEYPENSVTVTSVHDSSTIRQWWEDEKEGVRAFLKMAMADGKDSTDDSQIQKIETILENPFTPKFAKLILEKAAESGSMFCIHPLQDFLYLDKKYYLKNSCDERINVPGTVTDFNWTYQIPATVEELEANEKLCEEIKKICEKHS